jgi:hypothetical protein
LRIRPILYWLLAVAAASAFAYLYNPTVPTMVVFASLATGLTLLIAWSSPRLGRGVGGGILLMAISTVAGFMFSQGLEVAYSLLAAPAGQRLNSVVETAVAAVYFLALALLARVLLARPKIEK